jgi:hypothetical protein
MLFTALAVNLFVSLCSAQNVVHLKTQRNMRPAPLVKRASPPINVPVCNEAIVNGLGLYSVNLSIGNPPQDVAVQLDTGSSDLWTFGPASCDATTSYCWGGFIDSSKSKSKTALPSAIPFSIQYETHNSGVEGFYYQDNVVIGTATVSSLIMAQATAASYVSNGICGIGFDSDEASVNGDGLDPYPNIIDVMLSQGLIARRAYSLWLDDLGMR